MQRGGEGKDDIFELHDPFGTFSGFGSHRSMMPSLFGGRNPFDDPFFTRPFGNMFQSHKLGTSGPAGGTSRLDSCKGPVIKELFSDDEEEGENSRMSSDEPSIEHPDDDDEPGNEAERKINNVNNSTDRNVDERTQPPPQSYSFRKVTYGGVNGVYSSSSVTRRSGSDGVVIEESTAADKTTGQAAHRVSRGIHDKGHSITRTLNSDGKVDTKQTLHNLNEDEVAGFEENWKGRDFKDWKGGLNWHGNTGAGAGSSSGQGRQSIWSGLALPSTRRFGEEGTDNGGRSNQSFSGRAKKVVRIPIE